MIFKLNPIALSYENGFMRLNVLFYDFMMFFNMKIEWILCELKQLKTKINHFLMKNLV